MIQLSPEETEENTRLHYTDQASIGIAETEVYRHLVELISAYDPQTTFLAVITTPNRQVAVYQVKIEDEIIGIIDTYQFSTNNLDARIGFAGFSQAQAKGEYSRNKRVTCGL